MWDGLYGDIDVRRVQPYEANKVYICPGCNQDIPVGMGHYVCVPADAVDLPRHSRWHGPLRVRTRRRGGLTASLALRVLGQSPS